MAFTGTTTWYTSSNKYGSVTAWATGVAISVGDIRKQSGTPTAGNERCYVCIGPVGGFTTGASDPLTTFTRGVILTDNTTGKWQECTGISTMNGDMTNTPNWTTVKNTAITLGHVIQSNDGTKILICSVAGTAGNGAEPTWSTSLGGTTADNTATWVTLKISSNHFANWAAPHQRLRNATVVNWGGTAGTKFFIGNAHSATEAANVGPFNALGLIATPVQYLVVNEAGSMPPVTADLTTGAVEACTGVARIDINGTFYCYGLTWDLQATSGSVDINVGAAANSVDQYHDNCTFKYSGNNGSGSIAFNGSGLRGRRHMKDCTFIFGNAAQTISPSEIMEFYNCTFAPSGTVPSVLFAIAPGTGSTGSSSIYCQGCDMSAITGTIAKPNSGTTNNWVFDSCKISASLTNFFDMSNQAGGSFRHKDICIATRCGTDGKTNEFNSAYVSGKVSTEYTAVRTGGANDPGSSSAGYSLKMVTDSTNIGPTTILAAGYLATPQFGKYYNGSLNVSVTATMFGLLFAAALPTQFELYGEVYYLGTSASPQTTRKTNKPAQLDAAASLSADTASAWDSVASARINSHTYSVGDIIKTASAPGQIFQCTTGGAAAGSEPGGYTGAADGSQITDGAAVFRTCMRFKIALTLTSPNIQIKGNVTAKVYAHKASTTYYIDPALSLV